MTVRPVQLSLALLAALMLALAGVPKFFAPEPSGAIEGLVLDGRGYGVPDAAVFLFSERLLTLVEETRSDEDGRFSFQLAPERPRVFVRPPVTSGLASSFGPPAELWAARQAFVLRPARRIDVEVRDALGQPLPGAEVRAYERGGEAAVVALATTAADGHTRLATPPEIDIGVFAPTPPHIARWLFDVSVPEGGSALAFELPAARTVHGQVLDAQGPLVGLVLVSWADDDETAWNGFAVTDGDGRFELATSAAPTTLRVLDPTQMHLPARLALGVDEVGPLELRLSQGQALTVNPRRGGQPLHARVWAWSPQAEIWSWGSRTNVLGQATVRVAERFALHAQPLDPAFAPLEAWDVPFTASSMDLEAEPGG